MHKALRKTVAIMGTAVMLACTAAAVMPVPPASDAAAGSAAVSTFELLYEFGAKTRYETGLSGYSSIAFDIKRDTALARMSYGDFFLTGGWIRDAEMEPKEETYYPMPAERSAAYGASLYEEPENPEGDGFLVSGGLRNKIWGRDRFALHAYGQLGFWRESYDATATYSSYPVYAADDARPEMWPPPEPVPAPTTYTETYDITVHGIELTAGLLGAWTGERYTVYGGLDVLAYSDIEADMDVTSSDGANTTTYSDTSDVERDKSVSFVLGLKALFNPGFLLVETHSLGETSLRVGAGVDF